MDDFSQWLEKKNCFLKFEHVKSQLIYGKISNKKSEICIFIPTYKRADTLKTAIESAINQNTEQYYEIIVLDNDSEKNTKTEKLMKDYCSKHDNILYYKNEENIGMFGNWNRGFELAGASWIAMLHDDDILYPQYLDEVLKNIRQYDCGLISVFSEFMEGCNDEMSVTDMCKGQNKFKAVVSKLTKGKAVQIDLSDCYRSVTATPTACVYKRKAVLECGGFNDDYFPISDISLFDKMTYYYGAVIIPQFLAVRRIGENEMKNVLLDCTKKTKLLLREIQKKLYGKNRRGWIADYGAAVNHLIFLAKKYDPAVDIKKALKENKLPVFWRYVPKVVDEMILGCFWVRMLVRNRRRMLHGERGTDKKNN